jgi:hypothetical protein
MNNDSTNLLLPLNTSNNGFSTFKPLQLNMRNQEQYKSLRSLKLDDFVPDIQKTSEPKSQQIKISSPPKESEETPETPNRITSSRTHGKPVQRYARSKTSDLNDYIIKNDDSDVLTPQLNTNDRLRKRESPEPKKMNIRPGVLQSDGALIAPPQNVFTSFTNKNNKNNNNNNFHKENVNRDYSKLIDKYALDLKYQPENAIIKSTLNRNLNTFNNNSNNRGDQNTSNFFSLLFKKF